MEVLLLVLLLVFLIAINVPIAVSICAVALVGIYADKGVFGFYDAALKVFDSATNFPLIAIPLFILAGALMNTGGISRRLIDFTSALIGFIRGGLAMVNVGVSLFFAEISGSAVADVAAIGSVIIPEMKHQEAAKQAWNDPGDEELNNRRVGQGAVKDHRDRRRNNDGQ